MSTTAIISIKGFAEDMPVYLVKHFDGYPEGVVDTINSALVNTFTGKDLNKRIPLENAMISTLPDGLVIAKKTNVDIGNDYGAEYVYDIVLEENPTILVHKKSFDLTTDRVDDFCIYKGDLVTFMNDKIEKINLLNKKEGSDKIIKPVELVSLNPTGVFKNNVLLNEPLADKLNKYYKESLNKYKKLSNFETNPNYHSSREAIVALQSFLSKEANEDSQNNTIDYSSEMSN